MVPAIAVGTFCATLAGGLIALRLKDRLHLILGFSAGAVVGVALFDLIPEATGLAGQARLGMPISLWLAFGFATYMALDRLAPMHPSAQDETNADLLRGSFGAGSLSLHSFLDGLGIGLAFHVSASVGLVMALAALAHDFSDGMNTMNMVLKHGGSRSRGLRWLLIDALAPALGIGASYLISFPDRFLGPLLGLFAGCFLHIGASELVPESYHAHPRVLTTAMTV